MTKIRRETFWKRLDLRKTGVEESYNKIRFCDPWVEQLDYFVARARYVSSLPYYEYL